MLKIPSDFIADPDFRMAARQLEAPTRGTMLRAFFGFLAVALLIRGPTFGYPLLHIDEQFYLLVGDRMLHGALPYVDIWDRKPSIAATLQKRRKVSTARS